MKVRLLSWNIHKGIGMDRRFRPERVVEVLRHHDADVVLLQEVDRGVPRSRRLDLDRWLADEADYPYHCWAQNHGLQEGGYGNAVLARRPIRRKRNIDLTQGWRKKRSALYARIDLPGHWKDLHVFNWHLGLSAAERQAQVEQWLRCGTLRALPRGARVIVGGDSNDWRNRLFGGAGLREGGFEAWAEDGTHRLIATYPSLAPVGALDKFFWRGPLQADRIQTSRMQLARIASDHLPLVSEFTLEG